MKNDSSHCGLWLCIPGGMGVGCAAMAAALAKRLSRGCPSLPSYGSCTGGAGGGSFQEGYDSLMPCDVGFVKHSVYRNVNTDTDILTPTYCINKTITTNECLGAGYKVISVPLDPTEPSLQTKVCGYSIIKRKYPYWIKITVDGQTYKTYWHDAKGNGPQQNEVEYGDLTGATDFGSLSTSSSMSSGDNGTTGVAAPMTTPQSQSSVTTTTPPVSNNTGVNNNGGTSTTTGTQPKVIYQYNGPSTTNGGANQQNNAIPQRSIANDY